MLSSTEKFSEQFSRIQQQLKEWTSFEQLYAIVELTQTFQISYRHFLIQLFQANIQNENNVLFHHTVDDANSPDIVNCLLSNSLDKIPRTLQLYLPLISTKTINEKLLDAYRDVLIYFDKNLHPTKFSCSEQELINYVQQIFFFIHINPYLKKLSSHIPKLIYFIQTKQFYTDEQQYHQPLQRHGSIRSQVQQQPLMNFVSEGSHNTTISQQLIRHEKNDSGVDLTEPSITNVTQNFLSSHTFLERNLSTIITQKKHSSVGKTASSPIPEHSTIDIPVRVPLKGVLSAPPPTTNYSDYRQKNSNYQQQKHTSTLTKSDEDEQESQNEINDYISENNNNSTNNSKPLGQFHSLRYRNVKTNQNTEDVSQYLGVDTNSIPVRNTFIQLNAGMKDVPRWLKQLRLHKYETCFAQMTYDEMMNLTIEKLKSFRLIDPPFRITDGACTKILLNIKKLKERSALLKQCLIDIDNGQIDLTNLLQQLGELIITPIRSKQLEQENNSDEDLPKLIIEVLEKIHQQLTPNISSDICHSFVQLIDRCYRHEAFTADQVHLLLKWRRLVPNMPQLLGKLDNKQNQLTFFHSIQPRRSNKSYVTPRKSSSTYCSNYSSTSTPLSKFNSEPQNNNNNNNNLVESNYVRRPNKSPTLMYPTNEEIIDPNIQTSFSSIISTPQRHNGAYLANNQHQALTRKASIDPYGETNANNNNRTKLCKTLSDPNRGRYPNSTQSPIRPPQQQQSLFRMISTPYSHQQRQFIPRSPPPSSTMDTLTVSPIKKCHSDNERPECYGNDNNNNNTNDTKKIDDQSHNNTELESFCRRITESAIDDDDNDSSMDDKGENSDV